MGKQPRSKPLQTIAFPNGTEGRQRQRLIHERNPAKTEDCSVRRRCHLLKWVGRIVQKEHRIVITSLKTARLSWGSPWCPPTILSKESVMDRRDLLRLSAGGALAATWLPMVGNAQTLTSVPVGERGSVLPTRGNVVRTALQTNPARHNLRYMTPYRFGMGGTQIGNIFAPISDEQAAAVLQSAWDSGVRLFDTSPFYGFGLSEYRLGRFLHNRNPDDYVISTKVGRVFKAAGKPRGDSSIWTSPAPFEYRYDYTAAGARRSVEDSLQRLGLARIDVVYIHDLSPDNTELQGGWEAAYEVARTGAMRELEKMREEGLIKAWGFGINRPDAAVRAVEHDDPTPDIVLLACQYSIVDHEQALDRTLPALAKKGTSVVVGTDWLP
jgi:D-threo-aldose 1-dehydrogenase